MVKWVSMATVVAVLLHGHEKKVMNAKVKVSL
jgi:hypothetical protein